MLSFLVCNFLDKLVLRIRYHILRYMSISRSEIMYNYNMRLKDLREEKGISQKEIASYLNIKQNTYSQYETGKRQLPIEILVKIAKFYNTTSDYILELED